MKRYKVTETYLMKDVWIVQAETKEEAESIIYSEMNPAESEFVETVSSETEEIESEDSECS